MISSLLEIEASLLAAGWSGTEGVVDAPLVWDGTNDDREDAPAARRSDHLQSVLVRLSHNNVLVVDDLFYFLRSDVVFGDVLDIPTIPIETVKVNKSVHQTE
jgi:hypothetical protein